MNKEKNFLKKKKLITLSSGKAKKAFMMLIVMLAQIFMPIFTGMSEVYAETTETLLTTITATGKEQASYSVENVASVSFSYTTDGSSAYYNNGKTNWGWWGYGWTATVTPADGYTITKCVFYDDKNRTATDSEAPFVVETTEEDKTPKVNGTPILANQSKGITKIEIYGYVQSKTATITLNTNGGTINTGNITEYEEGTGATLPTDVTREGYIFLGWYDNENLTGSAVTSISTTDTGDKTFYAKWVENLVGNIYKDNIAINYWIKIKDKNNDTAILNAGTHSFTIEKRTSDNEFLVRINGNKLYISGDITKDAIGIEIKGGSGTNADPYTLGIVYPTKSSVTLNTNGGTINSGNITEYTEGTAVILPTDVTRADYTFAGWYDNEGLTGDKVTSISNTATGNKTYWAKWNENPSITGISFSDTTKTYDGKNYGITVTGSLPGGTIEYSQDGTNYSSTEPSFKNVGEYVVYYKATKEGYKDLTGNAKVTINARPITVKAKDKTITYGDSTPTFDYEIKSGSLVEGESLSNINVSQLTNTTVGTYVIEVSQSENSNPNYYITFENGTFKIDMKEITPEVTIDQNEFTYNGEEQKPTVSVKYNNEDLPISEYAVEFTEDSTNVGSKQVKVRSTLGNYTFTDVTKDYKINAKEIDSSMVTINKDTYVYDGNSKTPTIEVKNGTKTLAKDTDYKITGDTSETNAGNYTITVKGKGNYTGNYPIMWNITKDTITGVEVTDEDTTYDGQSHQIEVTIPENAKISYKTNIEDEYTNTSPSFKDAGNYTVYYKVEIDNNYEVIEGNTKVIIAPKDVTVTADNKSKVYGEDDSELTYTTEELVGKEKLEGITLSREVGEDVGTYKITALKDATKDKNYNITLIDGTFTINKKEATNPEIAITTENIVYTGKEIKPSIVVKDNDGNIIPDSEYTVSYSDNIEVGTGTITITNKDGGNYTVNGTTSFEIINKGETKLSTPETPNAIGSKLVGKEEEILSKIEFTKDELEAKENGKDIDVYLEVKDISDSVSESDKKAIEQKLGNGKIGLYLDINLFKKVEGEEATKITETKEPITISFEIPENLINKDSKVERTYKVLRLHDGVVDELNVKVNGNIATFETDEFSTYSLTYTDTIKTSNPQTGDNIGTSFIMLIISSLGLISTLGYTVISKKRKLVKTNN